MNNLAVTQLIPYVKALEIFRYWHGRNIFDPRPFRSIVGDVLRKQKRSLRTLSILSEGEDAMTAEHLVGQDYDALGSFQDSSCLCETKVLLCLEKVLVLSINRGFEWRMPEHSSCKQLRLSGLYGSFLMWESISR
jgi:hypothetical protein